MAAPRSLLTLHCLVLRLGGVPAVLQVLAAAHELLRGGRTATQRDLYYKLQVRGEAVRRGLKKGV